MRACITGQIGLDKKPFIKKVADLAKKEGHDVTLANVGDMMYAEAPDISAGRILDLPLSRLNALRRSVLKDAIQKADKAENLILNTHATFRWRHGLFPAFDLDQMQALRIELYITLLDNVDAVHLRLVRDHQINHTLKDLMVWREEEIFATEVLAGATAGYGRFYVCARTEHDGGVETVYRLLFHPDMRKVYLSFPMSHVMDMPKILADIDAFREEVGRHFIAFDPADMNEKRLHYAAVKAAEAGEQYITVTVLGEELKFDTKEVLEVARDIHGQIYARDFKMIDQADMIISYIPETADGKPGLSSGVERELQHAYEATKEVYVIWTPNAEPSPFVTETATRVFASTEAALEYFDKKGYLK